MNGARSSLPFTLLDRIQRMIDDLVIYEGSLAKARAELAKADAADELSVSGLRLYAAMAIFDGDLEHAIPRPDRALVKHGKDGDPDERKLDTLMRAEVLIALGRHGEALTAIEGVLAIGATTDARVAHALALQGLGRAPEAVAAWETSISEADELDDVAGLRLELAALHRQQGDLDAALAALGPAVDERRAEVLEAWVGLLEAVGRQEEAASWLAVLHPPPPDTRWLDAYPALAALRDDPALQALGVQFVDEEEARAGGEALRSHYRGSYHHGTIWGKKVWRGCRNTASSLSLLAKIPALRAQQRSPDNDGVLLYVNLSDPSTVRLAPSSEFPAMLFTQVGSSPAEVAEALRVLFIDVPKSVHELPKVARAFMGYLNGVRVPSPYSGEFEQAGPHELDRHFDSSPALDPMVWGSAYDDDPWPSSMPGVGVLQLIHLTRLRRAQREGVGAVARFTRRARFSGAHVAYELHYGKRVPLYVWRISYRPNPYPEMIRRFNRIAGTSYPVDLPVDVVAGLMGFDWTERGDLEAGLAQAGTLSEAVPFWLVLAAVRHEDPGFVDDLLTWARAEGLKPSTGASSKGGSILSYIYGMLGRSGAQEVPTFDTEVRALLLILATEYGWTRLVEEVIAHEPPGGERDALLRLLEEGIDPPEFDELGEPVGWGGGYEEE